MTRKKRDEQPEYYSNGAGRPQDKQFLLRYKGPLRFVDITKYVKGEGHRGGGISLTFDTVENAFKFYNLITANRVSEGGKNRLNPLLIDRHSFGCVIREEDPVPLEKALCIEADNPCTVHIETLGKPTCQKINGALKNLFDQQVRWPLELFAEAEKSMERK